MISASVVSCEAAWYDDRHTNSVCFVMTGIFSKKPSSDTRSDSNEWSACALHESSVLSLSKDGYRRDGRTIGSREYTSSPSNVEDVTVLECLCRLQNFELRGTRWRKALNESWNVPIVAAVFSSDVVYPSWSAATV